MSNTDDEKTSPNLSEQIAEAIAPPTDADDVAPEDIPVPEGPCQCDSLQIVVGADGSPFGPSAVEYAGRTVDVTPVVMGRLASDGITLLGHFCSKCGCRVEVDPLPPDVEAKLAEAEQQLAKA